MPVAECFCLFHVCESVRTSLPVYLFIVVVSGRQEDLQKGRSCVYAFARKGLRAQVCRACVHAVCEFMHPREQGLVRVGVYCCVPVLMLLGACLCDATHAAH